MYYVLYQKYHHHSIKKFLIQVSDERKKVPSSVGMKRSVETSKLLQHRAKEVVPDRIRQMRQVNKSLLDNGPN